jgi:hypoxanthine-guanine phosphoribosyltransferase
MPDSFQLTKLEAAQRQLSVAVRMLFDGQDPVAVHTLVGAASIVFTDLVEHIAPQVSWDRISNSQFKI